MLHPKDQKWVIIKNIDRYLALSHRLMTTSPRSILQSSMNYNRKLSRGMKIPDNSPSLSIINLTEVIFHTNKLNSLKKSCPNVYINFFYFLLYDHLHGDQRILKKSSFLKSFSQVILLPEEGYYLFFAQIMMGISRLFKFLFLILGLFDIGKIN